MILRKGRNDVVKMIKLSKFFFHCNFYLVFLFKWEKCENVLRLLENRTATARTNLMQCRWSRHSDIDSIYNSNYTEMHFKLYGLYGSKSKERKPLRLTNPYVLCSISSNRLQHCVFRNCIKHEEAKALAPAAVAGYAISDISYWKLDMHAGLDRGQINPN